MNEGGPTLEDKEAVWDSWFQEAGSQLVINRENMPLEAQNSWAVYSAFYGELNNFFMPVPADVLQAADTFKRVTGYEIKEVHGYFRFLYTR